MSRPRAMRGLYLALVFTGIIALYWFTGSENKNVLKQPLIQPSYGRGLKTKHAYERPQPSIPNVDKSVFTKPEQVTKPINVSPQNSKTPQNSIVPIFEVEKINSRVNKISQSRHQPSKFKSSKSKKILFSLADYKPGKNSPPLSYGLNVTLTRLNMEFSDGSKSVMAISPNKVMPSFQPKSANEMDIVGNIKVGEKIPDTSARHVLILTTWRSGSTFLGDLLNHYKGVFYYFEPLHYFSKSKTDSKSPPPVQNETDFLKSLYQCQFDKQNLGFLHHVSKSDNKFLFKNHNFRLWNTCSNLLPNDMMCLMPEYLNTVCPMYPIKLIKTVRLQMNQIENLITDSSLGLKVVFLVRDPRGTYNSRSTGAISKWCIRDECANPAVGCDNLNDNIKVAYNIETQYPGTIKLVRYEDLSMFTEDVTMDLLNFIGLPFTKEISSYINTHTTSDKQKLVRNKITHKLEHKLNPYGTARNSTATAFAWREKLDFNNIRKIQSACSEPMKRLGYTLYEKEEDVFSSQLPLLNNLDEIWPFNTPVVS